MKDMETKKKLTKAKNKITLILNILILSSLLIFIISLFILIWGNSELALKLFYSAILSFIVILGIKFVFVESVKQVTIEMIKPKPEIPKNKNDFRKRLDDAINEAHKKNI